ncbi:hypothetical protein [Phaeobacter sp. S60]|uniref:hypothetical protein n=1 Tax=Phaeobacter sp. S60 TaxID=1569353 RepID=UPI0005902879|nr:hypothetical protein [Phaeobacter sp. S60]KII18042.1 hypothetical protein OO25_03440 [Phaeobacter sp. S60]
MPKIDEQIEAIEKKSEQLRNRLRDLKAQATKQERKNEARRKLLYGAAYLAGLKTLSDDARRRSLARVEAHITRSKDRAFLGLERLPNDETSQKNDNSEKATHTPELPFEIPETHT